jgi:hypothetical protein
VLTAAAAILEWQASRPNVAQDTEVPSAAGACCAAWARLARRERRGLGAYPLQHGGEQPPDARLDVDHRVR